MNPEDKTNRLKSLVLADSNWKPPPESQTTMSREGSGLRLSSIPYTTLQTNPYQRNGIVLTVDDHIPSQHDHCLRRGVTLAGIILLLSAAVLIIYPSDPSLKLDRVRLNHVGVNSSTKLTLDLSFSLIVLVHNRDFFSLEYKKLVVAVGYRGKELGVVNSEGGHVEARGSSYVNATLDLNGFEVVHDVVHLIQDWAKGVIPFDTTTEVDGVLGVFPLKYSFNAKVSCRVFVNTKKQTIVHQDCC